MSQIRIGCSGWSYESWRDGVFYPKRLSASRRLPYYATRFNTVELNASFYRLPTRAAAERWAEQTPESFRFAIKVSRYLTHTVRLENAPEHLARLLDRIDPLVQRGKVGPLLWQLPPTFSRDDERLARTLEELPTEFRHAFEFRHPSWFVKDVYSLLREHDVAVVIADRPDLGPLKTEELTAAFVYVRFHYGSRGRRGNYSPGELAAWAERIRGWAKRRDVWAYFNNDWEGFAPSNAALLAAQLA